MRFEVSVPVTVMVSPTAFPRVMFPLNSWFPVKVHAPEMVWSFSQTASVLPESWLVVLRTDTFAIVLLLRQLSPQACYLRAKGVDRDFLLPNHYEEVSQAHVM